MAYLQQIAANGNNNLQNKSGNSFFSKIFNKWTFLISGGVALLLVIIIVLVSALNKVDTKDQDLMTRSYWAATYLNETALDEYANQVKNSDIRNMSASLKSVLNEIILNEANLMLSEHSIELDDTEEGEIAREEKAKITGLEADEGSSDETPLTTTLENGRLNGILDRTFLREITMQIAYLISYQSECAERTKSSNVKNFSLKAEANLQNLYDQFYNFNSPTI